jgi:hypothetical protein
LEAKTSKGGSTVSEERPQSIKPEQQQKLTEWLNDKAQQLYGADGLMHCPVCNSTDFRVGNMIAAIEITDESGEVNLPQEGSRAADQPSGYAIIPLRCGNCAYLMMFDAGEIGLTTY